METSGPGNAWQAALRELPAVDHLLRQPALVKLSEDYPRGEVVRVVRLVLDERRAALRRGEAVATDVPSLALAVRQRLYERSRPRLRKVINATGIVLHTGLGRAPLPEEAIDALVETASRYNNLEIDLATGRRGSRQDHLRDLLRELTGAEDAVVVNNNAAATFLVLNTLAAGREVIISRGQLVEIGGSYRLPEIMAAAQCRMVEVGTTNRTRISDYERALSGNTSVLLRVHTSNFRLRGFTESASLEELVALARRHNLLVVDDLGSGLLTDEWPWPAEPTTRPIVGGDGQGARPVLPPATSPRNWDEPTVRASVAAGADLTLFSGDKLLGGPQAGIIVGHTDLIAAVRRNPLARAVRPGKLTFAALEATLRLYRDPATAVLRIPVFRMLARTPAELENAAHALAQEISDRVPEAEVGVMPDHSEAGGGSLPTLPFPTFVVRVRFPRLDAEQAAAELRQRDVPIICRVHAEALLFDPRTLEGDEGAQIAAALAEIALEQQAVPPGADGGANR